MAINYMMQPINPRPSIMDTMNMVQGFNQLRDQRDARQMASQAQEQAAIQARMNEELGAALKAAQENPTAENRLRLVDVHAKYNPDKAKAFRDNWDTYSKDKQKMILNESVGILSALGTDPEYGIRILQEQAEAAKNAGNMEEAKKYQMMIDQINVGPLGLQSTEKALVLTIGNMPGGKEALEALSKFGEEQRSAAAEPDVIKKRIADLDYTKAQTDKLRSEIRKLDYESANALLKMEENKTGELYDAKDKAEAENSLRKEFDSKQKVFQQVKSSYDTITNAESTGIGDVALIFSYMKLLDPNSVVREGEVATTANAGGVPSAVMSAYNAALGKGKIDDKIRNQILSQSRKIFDGYGKQVESDKAFYADIAKRRGLNIENIIYAGQSASRQDGVSGGGTTTTNTTTTARSSQPVVTGDF